MHDNCGECSRLGSEYALAMRHYLKLQSRLEFARVARDEATEQELAPRLERASEERRRLQEELDQHWADGERNVGGASG
jgi:hypothetical protein